jgi:MFS family permease
MFEGCNNLMSAIPSSIRKFLDSGRGELKQLEQQYHIWVIITILAVGAGLLMFIVSIMLFLYEGNEDLALIRLLIGLAAGADVVVSYFVFSETIARRRYLLEVQRLMMSGLSFMDGIRRSLKEFF